MSLDTIKKLREMTSVGINDCRKALGDANGDFDKALKALRERGVNVMEKRSGRIASQGLIESYIHFSGNLGALVEVNCETDFVARTEVFKKFAKDVAMQIAACGAKYLKKEDVPAEALAKAENADEYKKQFCLMEQPFVKDSKLTMAAYLQDVISQTGENVVIRRFNRFSLGAEE
jgi:elongation factor Ts